MNYLKISLLVVLVSGWFGGLLSLKNKMPEPRAGIGSIIIICGNKSISFPFTKDLAPYLELNSEKVPILNTNGAVIGMDYIIHFE